MSECDASPQGCSYVKVEIDGTQFLSPALVDKIRGACDRVEEAGPNAILVVHVFGGGPDAACGQSCSDDLGVTNIHLVSQWEQAVRRVERLSTMSIAIVEGSCRSVAFELLLVTDYRLAKADLRMCLRVPSGAVWPGMAVYRLGNQVGLTQSRRFILFGDEIAATAAAKLGLVDDVVDDVSTGLAGVLGALDETTISELPVRRRLLLEGSTTSFEDSLGSHLAACARLLNLRPARDTRAAVSAETS